MKIDVVDDESNQLGDYIKELSGLYAARDKEIADAIQKIDQSYSSKIEEILSLIDNIKKMMS